jgi:hypothetical protein
MSQDIAVRENINQICAKREKALAEFERGIGIFQQSQEICKQAVSSFGGYYDGHTRDLDKVRDKVDSDVAIAQARRWINATVWQHILNTSGLSDLMNADQKKEWRDQLKDEPPEADLETVLATFENLWMQREKTFLEGMANVFARLDDRFKSHDAFKIGSRIILDHMFEADSGRMVYRRRDQFQDIERICAILSGKPAGYGSIVDEIGDDRRSIFGEARQSEYESEFFRVKGFKNGNAHLYFKSKELVSEINRALRAYYGEVLPDGIDRSDDISRSRSTAVSKDLAFYRTPQETAERVVDHFYIPVEGPILEPSAGDGALVHAAMKEFEGREIHAIEVNEGRYRVLKHIKGVKATRANFLALEPSPIYAAVIMNPPFYNTHWIDHVLAAWEWLKPGGRLVAILPVTAEVGQEPRQIKFREWVKKWTYSRYDRAFSDLPEGSFRESGTNINTVTLTLEKRA